MFLNKKRKYYVPYFYIDEKGNFGVGSSFVDVSNKLTATLILGILDQIRDQKKYINVVAINFMQVDLI